jgi:Protein of unknown function (DUF3182)
MQKRITRTAAAKRLPGVLRFAHAGEYDCSVWNPGKVYFVPYTTLASLKQAAQLANTGEHDLVGGVVPRSLVATKVITHPLVEQGAFALEGWSDTSSHQVQSAVLKGCSDFKPEHAFTAGEQSSEAWACPPQAGPRDIRTGVESDPDLTELTDVRTTINPNELAYSERVLETLSAIGLVGGLAQGCIDALLAASAVLPMISACLFSWHRAGRLFRAAIGGPGGTWTPNQTVMSGRLSPLSYRPWSEDLCLTLAALAISTGV